MRMRWTSCLPNFSVHDEFGPVPGRSRVLCKICLWLSDCCQDQRMSIMWRRFGLLHWTDDHNEPIAELGLFKIDWLICSNL